MSDALSIAIMVLVVSLGILVLIVLLFMIHTLLYLLGYELVSSRYKYLSGHLHGQAYYEFNTATAPYIQQGVPIYDGNMIHLIRLSYILHTWSEIC